MAAKELVNKLKSIDFQVTPGALEIINSSRIPVDELIEEIYDSWKEDEKLITVKRAINLILVIKKSPKYAATSKEVISELKSRFKEEPKVSRLLRRTYFTLKHFDNPVTAGHIARITRRKKITEKLYLNQLVQQGLVKKVRKEGKEDYFWI
ncbi:MAG: hypothetical protein ACFE8U_04310 [Candidatus Hermodarchaeota archaeon]